VGGVPDVITRAADGIVVAPEDAGALADGLRDALSRTWDEQSIAAAARTRTWDHVAGELHALLAAATGESVPAATAGRVMAQ
jgi:glycosyltransferase involved in cell wall biosynthesis